MTQHASAPPTATPRVVVTDYVEAELTYEAEEMRKRGVSFEAHQLKYEPPERVISAVRGADAVVVSMTPITAVVAEALRGCRVVIRHGAGYDNVDVPALTANGVPFTYIPDYCTDEVAEHAIALLFCAERQIVPARRLVDASIRNGRWDYSGLRRIRRMTELTLGIVGCGRIGSKVLEKLNGFGFSDILVCDPYIAPDRIEALGARIVDLDTLLATADLVTLHVPLNDETRAMIDARALTLMKEDAVLVNTARGAVVDQAALAQALEAGRLAGAGIDVFVTEPPEADHPLLGVDRAILTPHLAWYSEASAQEIRRKVVEEIDLALAGKPPRFCVNPSALAGRGR